MRSISKLGLMALAALLVCAAMASSASAVQIANSSGTPLSVGDKVTGTATGAKLSGTFFFIPVTVTCDSTVHGTVKANATSTGHAWGTIDSLTWSNCNSTAVGNCNVTSAGLPWNPASSGGNGGGLEATSTSVVLIGTGSNYIDVSNCMPGGSTCHLQGGTAGPSTDTGFSLSNYISAAWSNTAPQLSINTTTIKNNPCTATSDSWVTKYTVTEDNGNTNAKLV